jgi:hypothetical protein
MIGSHEEDLSLLRANTIQSIQEARERDLLLGDLISLEEHSVNVFQEYDRSLRGLGKQPIKLIIV